MLNTMTMTTTMPAAAAAPASAVPQAARGAGLAAGGRGMKRAGQRRYYWGVLLPAISAQARLGGRAYAAEAWHELFKRRFLGWSTRRVAVAGSPRPRTVRQVGRFHSSSRP